jgi:diketogulonate reductase-like aldo/keto reductase
MNVAVIPSSGARVSRIGIGTWKGFDAGNDEPRRRQLSQTLDAFFAAGGNLIDTSPMYGSAERVLGDVLATSKSHAKAWIATKVWTSGADAGVRQMNESMRLIRVDSVDLMQVHNLVDWKAHLKTLRRWKDEGRVRHIGITHYEAGSHEDVRRVYKSERVDTVQLNLSLDEPEAAAIAAECGDKGVAFIANRPFGGGASLRRVLTRPLPAWCAERGIHAWAHFMLKWVLSHPGVTVAIPGTTKPDHIADNIAATEGWLPDATARQRMSADWRAFS